MAGKMGDHIKKLQRFSSREMGQAVARGLFSAGEKIEAEAQQSIMEGSVSFGKHVPSLPGQPPNNDMGDLHNSIETHVMPESSRPTVEVRAGGPSAPYAPLLEAGTSKMAARPFMKPAADKHRADVAKEVAEQVSITIRRT